MEKELQKRTICFLTRDKKFLLGKKKEGFGKGNWIGIGGKLEKGETKEDAVKRELKEEIGVKVGHLEKIGILDFYFPFKGEEQNKWNQQVHIFLSDYWEGEIEESNEIFPKWFLPSEVDYENTWDDAQYWFNLIFRKIKFRGSFIYDSDFKVKDFEIKSF